MTGLSDVPDQTNILLAAVKAIAGILGNSYALVADAIESASDVASSLVVLGGIKIASMPADEDHPYGHGKAESIGALLVSIALCTAAAGIAIQSVREIVTPHHAPAPFTLVVLVLVVLTKEALFRFVIRAGTSTHSTAITTDAWHHRSDAITSTAAFVGITVALVGGKGYESADDVAALFASAIILFNGLRLLRKAVQEIIDAAPPADVETAVRATAAADRADERIENVIADGLAAARRASRLVAAGFCHWCAEPVGSGVLFCSTDCRDDHENEQRMKRISGTR